MSCAGLKHCTQVLQHSKLVLYAPQPLLHPHSHNCRQLSWQLAQPTRRWVWMCDVHTPATADLSKQSTL
jgi:hypothetical protein